MKLARFARSLFLALALLAGPPTAFAAPVQAPVVYDTAGRPIGATPVVCVDASGTYAACGSTGSGGAAYGPDAIGAAPTQPPLFNAGQYQATTLPTCVTGAICPTQTDVNGNIRSRLLGVASAATDATSNTLMILPSATTTTANPGQLGVFGFSFNGTTWDRTRGNTFGNFVQGSAAINAGIGASGNPILFAGSDGANVRTPYVSANGILRMAGEIAAAATDSGNPVKIGGVFNTTLPTYTTGQRGDVQINARGSIYSELFSATDNASPRIFSLTADGVGANSGLFVNARGMLFNGTTWDRMYGNTVGQFMQGPVAAGVAAVGNPVQIGGSDGTNARTAYVSAQGAFRVTGSAAAGAADFGEPVKVGGVYNTTIPTYTAGQRGDSQIDARGNLKVTLTDSSLGSAAVVNAGDGNGSTNGIVSTSRGQLYNGTSWDMQRSINNASTAGTGVAAAVIAPTSSVNAGIAPAVSPSGAATSLIAKASAGNLYRFDCKSSVAGHCLAMNRATVPTAGALTGTEVLKCLPVAAGAFTSWTPGDIPDRYSAGIVIVFSSATDCDTYTVSATAKITASIQ